jgi:phasin family protein
MTQPQAEFVDLYKAGLKTAADLMKVSLQSAEKLQNQQLVAIRAALDQQAKSISELGQARTLDDLLSLQTRLAGAQLERAVGYWTELYQTQIAQAQSWFSELGSAQAAATGAGIRQVARQQEQQQHQQHRKSA